MHAHQVGDGNAGVLDPVHRRAAGAAQGLDVVAEGFVLQGADVAAVHVLLAAVDVAVDQVRKGAAAFGINRIAADHHAFGPRLPQLFEQVEPGAVGRRLRGADQGHVETGIAAPAAGMDGPVRGADGEAAVGFGAGAAAAFAGHDDQFALVFDHVRRGQQQVGADVEGAAVFFVVGGAHGADGRMREAGGVVHAQEPVQAFGEHADLFAQGADRIRRLVVGIEQQALGHRHRGGGGGVAVAVGAAAAVGVAVAVAVRRRGGGVRLVPQVVGITVAVGRRFGLQACLHVLQTAVGANARAVVGGRRVAAPDQGRRGAAAITAVGVGARGAAQPPFGQARQADVHAAGVRQSHAHGLVAIGVAVGRQAEVQARLADETRHHARRHQEHRFAPASAAGRAHHPAGVEVAAVAARTVFGAQQVGFGGQTDLVQRFLRLDGETQHAEAVIDRCAIGSDQCHGGLLSTLAFGGGRRVPQGRRRKFQGQFDRGRADVADDRRDALPEPLLGIDADADQARLHELDHGLEVAEEGAFARLHVLDRAAPLDVGAVFVAAFAPDADDEGGGAVLEQCHALALAVRRGPTLARSGHRHITAASPRHHADAARM